MLSLTKFQSWQDQNKQLTEVKSWLDHIGKTGRSTRDHTDILHISSAHCKAPAFTLAGQYVASGQNYWESPKIFNEAMMAVILRHFKELSAEAMADLDRSCADTLSLAEDEIEAVRAAVAEAKLPARATA